MFFMCHNINPIAVRKAKIVNNFGLSECSKVKVHEGITFLASTVNFCYVFWFSSFR